MEIMLNDLTPEAQEKLMEFMGYKTIDEMIKDTNWDTFSIAEVYYPIENKQ